MIARSEWWATPVWEFDTGFDASFNSELLNEIHEIAVRIATGVDTEPRDSLWDYSRPNLDTLKAFINTQAINAIRQSVGEAADLNLKLKMAMAWVNVIETGDEGIEAHAHNDCSVTATYYIAAEPECGDLVLLDSSGMMNASGALANQDATTMPHRRITPAAGKLVIFPGYVIHEVQPNRSGSLRISLSTDMTQIIDKDAPNAMVLKSWCAAMLKVKAINV